MIVNEAIDTDASSFPVEILGVALGQVEYLLVLCVTFLGLVLVNGGFKYFLNVYRGVVGERMLRRLRYDLFVRLLRFPLPRFRRTSSGELVSTIVAETDPLGGYIGDSIALPRVPGRDAHHPADLHVHRGPRPRSRGHRAVPGAGMAHSQAAETTQ